MESAGVAAMPDEIASDLADRIRREAMARGIKIASVQGTFNMSHPDAESFAVRGCVGCKSWLQFCQRMGTSIIGICIGTRDRQNMCAIRTTTRPRHVREMVACAREAVGIAQHAGVTLALEPEVSNVVDSAKARRLLDEIGSPHLKITMDGANLFHAGELLRMSEILEEAFSLLGKDIILAHAKDLDHDGEAGHLAAGHGRLDYDRYLSLLCAVGSSGPLLLHGLSESQVAGCVAFLREKISKASLKGLHKRRVLIRHLAFAVDAANRGTICGT